MKLAKIFAMILVLSSITISHAEPTNLEKDVKKFKQELIHKFKFKEQEVNKVIAGAKYNDKIISTMNKPYEDKSYEQYKKLFVNQKRISEGRDFYIKNNEYLNKVSQKYGVDPAIIVAIIGIESNYGKRTTQFKTLDSLYTLAFYYPKRAKFFRYELTQFLILCRELRIPPESVQGSYAGALGIPQFMPSSYRHFARSTTNNHVPDLFDNQEDAMTSIGNYLNHFGWSKGDNIIVPVKATKKVDTSKNYTIAEVKKLGIKIPNDLQDKQVVSIIQVETDTPNPKTWLSFNNFKVIKKYNKSDLYALAVSELAANIESAQS